MNKVLKEWVSDEGFLYRIVVQENCITTVEWFEYDAMGEPAWRAVNGKYHGIDALRSLAVSMMAESLTC